MVVCGMALAVELIRFLLSSEQSCTGEDLFFAVSLRPGAESFSLFTPKAVSRLLYEHILEVRLCNRDRVYLSGKCFDNICHKAVRVIFFDPYLVADNANVHIKFGLNPQSQR